MPGKHEIFALKCKEGVLEKFYDKYSNGHDCKEEEEEVENFFNQGKEQGRIDREVNYIKIEREGGDKCWEMANVYHGQPANFNVAQLENENDDIIDISEQLGGKRKRKTRRRKTRKFKGGTGSCDSIKCNYNDMKSWPNGGKCNVEIKDNQNNSKKCGSCIIDEDKKKNIEDIEKELKRVADLWNYWDDEDKRTLKISNDLMRERYRIREKMTDAGFELKNARRKAEKAKKEDIGTCGIPLEEGGDKKGKLSGRTLRSLKAIREFGRKREEKREQERKKKLEQERLQRARSRELSRRQRRVSGAAAALRKKSGGRRKTKKRRKLKKTRRKRRRTRRKRRKLNKHVRNQRGCNRRK